MSTLSSILRGEKQSKLVRKHLFQFHEEWGRERCLERALFPLAPSRGQKSQKRKLKKDGKRLQINQSVF